MTAGATAGLPPVLGVKQVAAFLGRSYKTVLNRIDDGSLQAKKVRGTYYIRREWLEDFLENADLAESA